MDPVAHTLVGACLAETGLKRTAPLATVTLIVGANLPDIDAVTYLISGDTALLVRRGWTHGVLAVALLPLVLVAGLHLADRWWHRRSDRPRIRCGPLVALAYVAVLSHPAMDWLNTYGVRLLMPFDGHWFYGDSLFIVDPWLWLLVGVPVALAHTRRLLPTLVVLGAAVAATLLVWRMPFIPAGARLAWLVAVGIAVAWRAWRGGDAPVTRFARAGLVAAAAYVGAMILGTSVARADARAWAEARQIRTVQVTPMPVPANPFARDVVLVTPDAYYFAVVDWLHPERVRFGDEPITRQADAGPIARAALDAPQAQGLAGWIRFPAFEVRALPRGYRVLIQDVRFSRMRNAGIGYMTVDLDLNLRPVLY